MHFGSLVAALGSFLDARRCGGEWWVRIEDVDAPRARSGAADAILRALERFQLHWDGPVLYQSRRTDAYRAALARLLSAGLAYPCTCSRRELAACPRGGDGAPIYPGHCRAGVGHPGRPAAVRLRVDGAAVAFRDAVRGEFRQCLTGEVGDFVIRRADGLFAYQLAVVVDDAAQGITRVVRGADLLDSTPRQIHLQRLLGLPEPAYAHLPVAVDQSGHKLSKQAGAAPLDADDPAPALWAALRFLGQNPPADLRRESPATLLAWARDHWRLASVPTAPCRFWEYPPAPADFANRIESPRRTVDKAKTLD